MSRSRFTRPCGRHAFAVESRVSSPQRSPVMKFLPCLALPLLLASAALAADLPAIPQQPIAKKGKLLFQDDFEGTARPKEWHRVVDTFVFENGTLKGTQTREK